jgi:hypothetical protein
VPWTKQGVATGPEKVRVVQD